MMENRPGGHRLWLLSRQHNYFMVGEQIIVEQLTELSIVIMRISWYDHVYRHHVRDK